MLFLIPTVVAFYFSLTRWNLTTSTFIGLDNFKQFFNEPALVMGLRNTLIYAVVTSGAKVVLGMGLALLLTSKIIGRGYLRSVIFFPVLVSTIGVGITFVILMNPTKGLINKALALLRHRRPRLADQPQPRPVFRCGGRHLEGRRHRHRDLHRRDRRDPGGVLRGRPDRRRDAWQIFRKIILPLSWPATSTVIILSLIGGLRSFDLIWAMTKGGPGFSSDVIASVIYKQYQAGFFGLSTAGNVVLFLLVTVIILPLTWWLNRRRPSCEIQTVPLRRRHRRDPRLHRRVHRPVRVHRAHRRQGPHRSATNSSSPGRRTGSSSRTCRQVWKANDYQLRTAFINSTILTVVSVAILVVLGAMCAYVLQRRKSVWNVPINLLVLSGLIIPPAVVPTIWVLQGIGLFKTLPGLILVEVAFGLSFSILLFRAFISSIPVAPGRGRQDRRLRIHQAVLQGHLPAAAAR